MNRRSLGVVAIVLIVLMAIVATAGLDNLPRHLRDSVASAPARLSSDRAALDQNRQFIEHAVTEDPALFGAKAAKLRQQLDRDRGRLDSAASEIAGLQQLAKANRRTDADKVEKELGEFDHRRQGAVQDSAAVRAEAEKWLRWKQELPQRAQAMRASYDAVKAYDLNAAAGPVQKAMTDWPQKRDDLNNRLEALRKTQSDGESIWQSTAAMREAAESGNRAGFDYPAFFSAADRLDATARDMKNGVNSLNALAAQLYTSWDKILIDAGDDNGSYREKFRVVRTTYPDATLANGQVATEERWEPVDRAQYRTAERQVGMTVEHKAAGKYDSEAERAVQPPVYAYVAPPGQANAYGAWSGGVWHWLPQYLILSHLLNRSQPAITSGDFDAYRSARGRGEIFYGRNNEYRPPNWNWNSGSSRSRGWSWGSGSSSSSSSHSTGGWWKERPKTWGSGGFSGSQYKSRGSFSGSRFQSRGSFSRGFGGAARSFGRGGRR